jgi:hypothetical protein
MHALAPAPAYVPARQSTHALTLLAPLTPELLPAAQFMHTLALVAPATPEYAPAGQFVHCEFPVTFLNFPATQAEQVPPSGPVYPGLHLQEEIDFDDVLNGVIDCAGHVVHTGTKMVMSTLDIFKSHQRYIPGPSALPLLIKTYLPVIGTWLSFPAWLQEFSNDVELVMNPSAVIMLAQAVLQYMVYAPELTFPVAQVGFASKESIFPICIT